MTDAALATLAERWGVQTGYWDVKGRWNEADPVALRAVLSELGAPVDTVATAEDAAAAHDRLLAAEPVEPVMVVPYGRPLGFVLRTDRGIGGAVEVTILAEDGTEHRAAVELADTSPYTGFDVDGVSVAVRWIDTGIVLPMGYHRATVTVADTVSDSLVLAPPGRLPQFDHRMWGVFAPTYGFVPTGRPGLDHLGVGHLGHLDDLGRRLAEHGAEVVSTLPLLATYLDEPFEPSPYSPVSRRWWGELHLDPGRLPGLDESPSATAILSSSRVADAAADLASGRLLDHAGAAALVRSVLDAVATDLSRSLGPTATAVEAFAVAHPELGRYARFRAMVEQYGPDALTPVTEAPPALDPAIVARHRYIQFAADAQLADLASSFGARGQLLALDLPLGANPGGFDVWADPANFANAATGAPPDDLFGGGQNWGFPPPHPIESRARGHRELMLALRHHLRHTGLLRIDHLMSLERLWWIPDGHPATDGVYVRYPTEELVAVIAIEATRANAVVVGENLGTVTDEINEVMQRWGMLGMFELQFEPWHKREHGHLRQPAADVIASLNTHDMPTLAGWWEGSDIDESVALGLIEPDERAEQVEGRVADREALVEGLAADLGTDVAVEPAPALRAALEWMGASPAAVVLTSLEDLWLEPEPQNIPGTHRERPNWQRRFSRTLDDAFTDPDVVESLRALDRARRSDDSRKDDT